MIVAAPLIGRVRGLEVLNTAEVAMAEVEIRLAIQEATKTAMRSKDQRRLNALRLMSAAIKQKEIDSRVQTGGQALSQADVLAVLDKMLKQRRDSFSQYAAAHRQDLADQEAYEIGVIEEFLPAPLSEQAIDGLIEEAIKTTGAASEKDMGKVMTIVKPQLQGRADMKLVSEKIKEKLQ